MRISYRRCERIQCSVPGLKAKGDVPVIKGSFASPEAVAQIMTQKFLTGVPLYRQEQEFAGGGIHWSRQTMSNWLIRCAEDWLQPLYDLLHGKLCRRKVLHAYAWVGILRELPKTLVGKAIHYARSQRMYLVRYLLDGRLEISNNRAGNAIRPFVMGRKNGLFSNTPNGADVESLMPWKA